MYAVNQQTAAAARKSENRTSFINEKGKYLGRFSKAEVIKAKSGARGLAFSFKSIDGAQSDFKVYTHRADGTELGDLGLVIALMTCLSVRDMKPVKLVCEEYDRDQKKMVKREYQGFKELVNVDIGVLITMEEFEKTEGGTAWSARLNAVFRATDELVASEILDRKTQPVKLAQLVLSLRDKPMKNKPANSRGGDNGSYAGDVYDDSQPPFDDEIPF